MGNKPPKDASEPGHNGNGRHLRNGSAPDRGNVKVFARAFLKDPLNVASVIPSSRYLIQHVLSGMALERASVIIEYGPGVGPITRAMLARMRPDAHLVALERDVTLADHLREAIDDPRLHVENASAEEAPAVLERLGLSKADYVISGIPFSMIPLEGRRQIVRATREALLPNGSFVVYNWSKAVLPHLRDNFRQVRQEFEPRNVPPMRLFYAA